MKIKFALKTLQFEPHFPQLVRLVSATGPADLACDVLFLLAFLLPCSYHAPAASACLFFSGGKNPLR